LCSRGSVGSAGESVQNARTEAGIDGRGQGAGSSLPISLSDKGAINLLGSWCVSTEGGSLGVDLSKSSLVVGIVQLLNGARAGGKVDLHQSVSILFLRILVDDASREDVGHLRRVEGQDLGEISGQDLVAAIFGEHDGDGPVGKVRGHGSITGALEGGISAPSVDVNAVKVWVIGRISAGKVALLVGDDGTSISDGIADGSCQIQASNVSLDISNGSFDECRCHSVVGLIGNFVGGNVAQDIGVLFESIDLGLEDGEEILVPSGIVAVDGLAGKRSRNVQDDVDAGLFKLVHGVVMVGGGIGLIHSDAVDAEVNEVGEISVEDSLIGQDIIIVEARFLRLISDTLGPKLRPGGAIEEEISLDDDLIQGHNG